MTDNPYPSRSSPTVRIEKLVPGGHGLGHLSDGVVFVPLTAPGDLVSLKNVHRRRGVYFGECDRVVESSPDRVKPPCPWFGRCGGCQWMHLDNPAQLSFKEDIFRQALQRIAHIGDPPPVRLHQSPARYGYRFRARLQIKGADAGFYKRQTSDIISWDTCMQLPETLNVAVKVLRKILRGDDSSGWLSVCETAASPVNGAVTFHWHLDKGKGSRDRANGIFDRAEELTALENISLAGQTADDRKGRAIASRGGSLILNVKGASLRASPGTFFQVNPGVNEVLVERVLSHLASAGAGSLLDLYCGNGNFSLPAADSGIKTFGVESSGKAISDALGAAGPESGFVEEDVTVFLSRDEGSYDAVIVDPPRTGLPPEAAAILGVKRPRTLLYVSCEPSTLARDLARFIGYGFTVTGMELFDMFPQTSHMEALVVMQG